jgi:hypothetical protein
VSRKREEKRDKERELARQLGVAKDDVSHTLLEKGRSADIELKNGRIDVESEPRALLSLATSRTRPHVVAAVYLVSPAGLAHVVTRSFSGAAIGAATSVPLAIDEPGPVRVRYERPAHFVVVALAFASDKLVDATALVDPARIALLVPAGAPTRDVKRLDDAGLAKLTVAQSARVFVDGKAPGGDLVGAAVLAVGGVHRFKDEIALPFAAPDGKRRWSLVAHLAT